MEYPEFSSLARQTMAGLLDRLPTQFRAPFEGAMVAGELRYGVKHLALVVRAQEVPVTAEEQQAFRRLLEYLGEPTTAADEMTVG
jgi:hypothetical protein